MNEDEKAKLKEELLYILVVIEKLKHKQKRLFKEASTLLIVALVIIGVGAYGSVVQWTSFPIFQGAIAAGGILLAIAFRPVQRCRKQIVDNEKLLQELESLLKKNTLDYKADIRVHRLANGEYDVKKSIKLFTVKP